MEAAEFQQTSEAVSHSSSETAVCNGAHRGRQATSPEGSHLLHMLACLLSPPLHPCTPWLPPVTGDVYTSTTGMTVVMIVVTIAVTVMILLVALTVMP